MRLHGRPRSQFGDRDPGFKTQQRQSQTQPEFSLRAYLPRDQCSMPSLSFVVQSSCQAVPVTPYTPSLGGHSIHACHQDLALIAIYLLYNTKPDRVAKKRRLKFASKPASSPQGQVEAHSLNVASGDILWGCKYLKCFFYCSKLKIGRNHMKSKFRFMLTEASPQQVSS